MDSVHKQTGLSPKDVSLTAQTPFEREKKIEKGRKIGINGEDRSDG